jgi:hypothetical protein
MLTVGGLNRQPRAAAVAMAAAAAVQVHSPTSLGNSPDCLCWWPTTECELVVVAVCRSGCDLFADLLAIGLDFCYFVSGVIINCASVPFV